MIRVVDLFCGAGGLSLGFTRAGLGVVLAVDHWKPATQTYAANLGPHVQEGEISEDMELPECEVIAGGPPCQGFSSAGLRRSGDKRNSFVGVFSRLIARHRPRAFVFENVEGFLTSSSGYHVLELLEPLIDAGYRIHLRKINAANFGVPQHRKRVVAIGGLGWTPDFPKPTHIAFGAPGAGLGAKGRLPLTPTLGEAMAALNSERDDLLPLRDHDLQQLEGDDLERARLLRPGQSMRDLPEELWHPSFKKRAFRRVMDGTPTERRGGAPSGIRRLKNDEPSKAITGGSLADFLHPTEDRPLTVRECAVLQTFPLDFQLCGSTRDRMQLIGNAVPPLFSEVIGRCVARGLLSAKQPSLPGALLSFVPTESSGMSPALDEVLREVQSRFHLPREDAQARFAWL